jgi:hypothetical protein
VVLGQPYLNVVPATIGQFLLFSAFQVDVFKNCGVIFIEIKKEMLKNLMLYCKSEFKGGFRKLFKAMEKLGQETY